MSASTSATSQDNPLGAALRALRAAFAAAFGFGSLVNLLMLTGPLFMLQVYDRVLTSRSVPTTSRAEDWERSVTIMSVSPVRIQSSDASPVLFSK